MTRFFFKIFVGHYVPQLAELIYDGNKGANRDRVINIKGFMVSSLHEHTLARKLDSKAGTPYARDHAVRIACKPALAQQIGH